MAKFEITSPSGERFEVTAPDGATQEQVLAYAKQQFTAQTNPAKQVSGADRLKALEGGLYRGAAGLVGLPMDTIENLYNLGKAAVGTVAGAAGRTDLMPEVTRGTPLGSAWIADQFEKLGVNTRNPRPDDRASRMLYTGGLVAGGGITPKGALPAALGAAVAGEISDNPLAPAFGAMAPAAIGQAVSGIRAASAERAARNLETFKQAGAQPTVGMVTENSFLQGLENLASKFPGGAGVFKKFSENLQTQLGSKTRTGVSAEDAGRAIEKGITGKQGFIERTRDTWKALDDAVARKIANAEIEFGADKIRPIQSPINTLKALDDLTTPIPGAEKTTGALVNPRLVEMKQNIIADISKNNGALPYDAMRQLRTRVGSMLDDSLVSGVPAGELKKVYGALSKDLEATASQAGAAAEFARQNKYYSARMDRIETVLERVLGKGKQPEDIFKSVNPTDPSQSNKLRSVMRSLKPEERKVVSDAVVNRLGRATPGRQDEFGELFSSETFLTNWNKLSPGAKSQLFPEHEMRKNLDSIASAAWNIREGSKGFSNPSGTAGSFAAYGIYSAPVVAVTTGSVSPLVAAGLAAGSAKIGAKMMTSPKVVEWLAKVPKVKPDNAAAHFTRLGVIFNETQDESLKSELSNYITSVSAATQLPQQ